MRQLSPLSNLLLACLASLGLVACLRLPWYGPAGPATDPDAQLGDGPGPMEVLADRIARTFSTSDGSLPGTDVLGSTRTFVVVAAAVIVVLSLAMMIPVLRATLRDVLRAAALAVPLLVAFLAFDRAVAGMELRWGVLVAVAAAAGMASLAWHGSAAREPRSTPVSGRRLTA